MPLNLQANYHGEAYWQGNTASEAVSSLLYVLAANGVSLSAQDRIDICAWANEQWCEKSPARCIAARNSDLALVRQRSSSLVAKSMQWATPFWQILNVAVSDVGRPDDQVGSVLDASVRLALHLTSGNYGCPDCHAHFETLLQEYPIAKVVTWKQARVWLWRVHNESRDSGVVVPYYNIAVINGWEILEDEEVLRIIEEELRA